MCVNAHRRYLEVDKRNIRNLEVDKRNFCNLEVDKWYLSKFSNFAFSPHYIPVYKLCTQAENFFSNGRFVLFQEQRKWTQVFSKILPFSIFLIDKGMIEQCIRSA